MKNHGAIIGSLFLLTILIIYFIKHLSSPVFGGVVFPNEIDTGVFKFSIKHNPELLHLGIRMPKGEVLQDCVLNITIIDQKSKHIILKNKFNLTELKKMSNTSMNKDSEYDYYNIVNIQSIGIIKNKNYLIKIENIEGGLDGVRFVLFIRGLFH